MAPHPIPIARRDDGRILAGVAAGLGAHLGIDPNIVRLAFVVLSLAGGLGVLLYGAGWFAMAPPGSPEVPPRTEPDFVQTAALGAVVLGALLLARAIGLWFGDAIVWPLAVACLGLALLWMRPSAREDAPEVPEWPFLDKLPPAAREALGVLIGTRRGAFVRLAGGALLVFVGIIVFVTSADSWDAVRAGLFASFVVVAGLALALGPGLWRLASALVDERRERIRADERADMAAHLHDSVLQTLALIQRRADDPREVVRIARHQERELRSWLLAGKEPPTGSDEGIDLDPTASFGGALEEWAAAIETEYGVPIDVVRVRDCPLGGLEPLLLAAREGMVNAVRHSGAPRVSVYVEVSDTEAVVFVRDRGVGFDPSTVAADRGGLAASIVGRLARHGGAAKVRSKPGMGCELELSLPRRVRDAAEQ
jgi:signal transduction histidine kinase/phage shock protein PspC (stress-responsive transcriptional regulator)